MYIAIDFDGTCVTHEFPYVGKDIGAESVLHELLEKGHRLILHTMRGKETIQPALDWFSGKGIKLFGVNSNPTQWRWTDSKKVYAHLYIDDAALGVPLKYDQALSEKPFVDWYKVRELLISRKIL